MATKTFIDYWAEDGMGQHAAGTAAANLVKAWVADYAAGDSRLYIASEAGNPVILGSNEIQLYNTADITTNYERFYQRWDSNVLKIGFEKGGSGTGRQLHIYNNDSTILISGVYVSIAGLGYGPSGFTFTASFYPDNAGADLGVSTAGWRDVYFGRGANGQEAKIGVLTELTTIAAAAYTDTTIQIPANSIVMAVTGRVTVEPTTTATMDIGVAGATTRYGTGILTDATTTWPGTIDALRYYATAVSIRITPNATPSDTAGRIRVNIHYITVTPPTS